MIAPVDSQPSARLAAVRLSPAEAVSFNVLVASGRSLAFAWAGQPAQLHFTAPLAESRAKSWLQLQIGEHAVELGLLTDPEPARLGLAFAGIELVGLPDELRLGVLESCLEEPLQQLRAHGLSVHLVGWAPTHPTSQPRLGWQLNHAGQRWLEGTLHAPDEVLELLAELATRVSPKATTAAATLPVSLHVALAELNLPIRMLREISAGDVLLPPLTREHWDAGRCTLWAGQRRIGAATFQQASVQLLAMKDSTRVSAAPSANSSANIDELPVQLLFDIGQVDLTVGQLRTLGEGYTFTLPTAPDRFVTLRANGREIGQGELVDLGDKLGVRVSTWNLQ